MLGAVVLEFVEQIIAVNVFARIVEQSTTREEGPICECPNVKDST